MASVQLLTAGSREGGRDPSRFPLLLLLSDTGFAVGDRSHTSNSCLCTAAGMPCLVQVSVQVSTMSPCGHQGISFLRHNPRLTCSPEGMSLRQVAGSREEASCGHILIPFYPLLQNSGF